MNETPDGTAEPATSRAASVTLEGAVPSSAASAHHMSAMHEHSDVPPPSVAHLVPQRYTDSSVDATGSLGENREEEAPPAYEDV